jgi:cell division protein FtsI (penicillin-binding protein 3)
MNWRYKGVMLFFICAFIILLGRLFYWQIVRAEELTSLGESQYGQNIKQIPTRGEIRTSDGFPIAANKINYLVFANPKDSSADQKSKISKLFAPILGLDEASISANLSLNRFWVPLAQNVDEKTKNRLESLKFNSIGFEEQTVRFYPEASFAAKLTGFVGKNKFEENYKGYFGLEGYYDRQLSGKTGLAKVIKDALDRPILAEINKTQAKTDGRNLILHVDRTVQYILDRELRSGLNKYGAQGSMGIIMNPQTGGIIAMSGFPSFDQGNYNKYDNDLYLNPMISKSYEPGSTFKPLIMAAAINSGLVKPDTKCPVCDKPIDLGGFTIRTWNDKYIPNISMTDIIRESDNTGMVYVAKLIGLKRMFSYLQEFGIGKLTGIDLQGEMAPPLRSINSWYPIDLATAGFGQGISVTPIELLTAFSSLANEGKRMEPHVVAKVETANNEMIDIPPKVVDRPISAQTAIIIRELLVNAVKNGEAKWAAPKGYRIAGKTGTAQIPIAGHYDLDKTIASFIGYAPADDPKFSMLIIYNQPTTSIYGAETAAPTFFNIARKLFQYYSIPPSE